MTAASPSPFRIAVPEDVLTDLRRRIEQTRWPDQLPGVGWTHGTDLAYLHPLLAYWANEFDWHKQEERLNGFAQFRVEIAGTQIHFVHQRARHGAGIPLLLTHGWPSSFIEYLPLVGLLTDPADHGIDGPAFDLVIASMPGYTFSERSRSVGVNYRQVAAMWRVLMSRLGYSRYGVGGGDFGAGVASLIALDDPATVIGVHLTNLELAPPISPDKPLTEEEQRYLAVSAAFWERESGYKAIQSTKPMTLAYGLSDSPAGLAAWILEKWRSWSDCHGDLESRFDRDFLLTLASLYWITNSISSSIRDYFDNRWHPVVLGPDDRVEPPTAVAVFGHQTAHEGEPPRSYAERLYNVVRWTVMPRGGHFAPAEEPELVAGDIASFFGELA